MIKIEHNDREYWIVDETNIMAIEKYEPPYSDNGETICIEVLLIGQKLQFLFSGKEKAQYFLEKYFKDVIE